jgi:hypothetical protein
MPATALAVICTIACGVVLGVLAALAAAINLLTVLLPDRTPHVDAALVGALADTVAQVLPGARVTRIEEEP